MLLVDSSVWIDAFRGVRSLQVVRLNALLDTDQIVVGDLILAEVLQGCDTDREFAEVRRRLAPFQQLTICNPAMAIAAADNYRRLRALGITVRKTIDSLIATRCIVENLPLLFSDRDFQPFVDHLGLRDAMAEMG